MGIEPRRFGPLAEQTHWTPIADDAIPFVSCEIAEVSPGLLVVRKDRTQRVFGAMVIAMAVLPVLLGAGAVVAGEVVVGMLVLVGGVGGLVAGYRWRSVRWPVVIDGASRVVQHRDGDVTFDDVVGLQVLSRVYGTERQFVSYELNAVLRDGGRRNLLDHGERGRVRVDAERVRQVLGCPLWDATVEAA